MGCEQYLWIIWNGQVVQRGDWHTSCEIHGTAQLLSNEVTNKTINWKALIWYCGKQNKSHNWDARISSWEGSLPTSRDSFIIRCEKGLLMTVCIEDGRLFPFCGWIGVCLQKAEEFAQRWVFHRGLIFTHTIAPLPHTKLVQLLSVQYLLRFTLNEHEHLAHSTLVK